MSELAMERPLTELRIKDLVPVIRKIVREERCKIQEPGVDLMTIQSE